MNRLTIILALSIPLGACVHDGRSGAAPAVAERGGTTLESESEVEELRPSLDLAEPPWGDLDWREEGAVILCSLAGDDRELLRDRGAFVGEMLIRRTRGLGELRIDARDGGASGRRLEISGDETARAAAKTLLQGLKESRTMLGFDFRLVDEDSGETVVGPMSLSVLAGRTASISVLDETAYVQDFDVELAQSSFIADPVVAVVTTGVVVVLRPFADPDGRVDLGIEITTSALARPIAETRVRIEGGEDVTIQNPEILARTRRARCVIAPESESFLVAGIEMPAGDGDSGFGLSLLRLEGGLRR